ncbi:efflux RND transporter periplasmic adaptor subunit [Halomonas caseinilytica]|uniref:RND family efflux transporter, MFP subunit n=1 Tax=Halomonas caseinilytica TaxID=438744 RepID=A0A1M6QHZ6_9GAMM|nr:efflux RND transporter periplasmic adaptor subunit [Halomonas caseinilytica]SHK19785.1 RND family efflux transporter, MFP subunit [Halomonas caseinilytica]
MPPTHRPSALATLLCGLAGLALLLTGCSPDTSSATEIPTVVDSHVVQAGNATDISRLSGRVKAAEHTTLSFEIAGKLERVAVDVGDPFDAGEPLATLDDERYRLVAQQRRAEAREAEASLIEKRQDYQRQSSLAEKGYVSDTQLDTARAGLDTAESRHASAVAALELAERDLAQTTLTAPFDGSVSARQAEPSERVAANQAILEVISDREGFEVETSVPETLIDALSTGSNHKVSFPALGGITAPATLTQLGTQPRSSNNYPVILALDEPPKGIHAGMTAEVELSLAGSARDASVLPIPLTALVYDDDQRTHVLRIDEDERLESVEVAVVDIGEGHAKVRGELAPGDRIVARGTEFVDPGQTVSLLGQGPERYN